MNNTNKTDDTQNTDRVKFSDIGKRNLIGTWVHAAGYCFLLFVLVLPIYLAKKGGEEQKKQDAAHIKKYLVTQKADNKILYSELGKSDDWSVMTFGEWSSDTILYKYINPGDTLTGYDYKLGAPVTKSWYVSQIRDTVPTFSTVNGRSLQGLRALDKYNREIARRDSLVRDMQIRQK